MENNKKLLEVITTKTIDITNNNPYVLKVQIEIEDKDFISFLNTSEAHRLDREQLDTDLVFGLVFVTCYQELFCDYNYSLKKALKESLSYSFRTEKHLDAAERKVIKEINKRFKGEMARFSDLKNQLVECSR